MKTIFLSNHCTTKYVHQRPSLQTLTSHYPYTFLPASHTVLILLEYCFLPFICCFPSITAYTFLLQQPISSKLLVPSILLSKYIIHLLLSTLINHIPLFLPNLYHRHFNYAISSTNFTQVSPFFTTITWNLF